MQIIFNLVSDPTKVIGVEIAVFEDGRQTGDTYHLTPELKGTQATVTAVGLVAGIDTDLRVREWAPGPTDWRAL